MADFVVHALDFIIIAYVGCLVCAVFIWLVECVLHILDNSADARDRRR